MLSATLPGLGAGGLKNREDAKALGTSKVCFTCSKTRDVNFFCLFRNRDYCSLLRLSTRHSQSSVQGLMYQSICFCSVLRIRMSRVLVGLLLPADRPTLNGGYRCMQCNNMFFTIAALPHYTSGQTYYYPAFNAARAEDALKFAHEFGEVLAMPIMLEAVMRVRASRGTISSFRPGCSCPFLYMVRRTKDGIVPRKLFCAIDRLARDAGGAAGSGICD